MFLARESKRQSSSGNDDSKGGGFFGRLKNALRRTRGGLVDGLAGLLGGNRRIDADLLDDLETLLLSADVGLEATDRMVEHLRERMRHGRLGDAEAVLDSLRDDMLAILEPVAKPLDLGALPARPYVMLMVGVNGTGKTTSIGKLAHRFQSAGHSVMLAAGDTFRAAATEQLQGWGARNEVTVVAQHAGADSASVIYDAVESAAARGVDVLIADTAGRLHTQTGLMDELKKVRRVITKLDASAPHEVMLVIDAGTGQNALTQARQFDEAVGVTGITLTKLDGTARGGMVFAMAEQLGIPIRYVGVGEGLEDLREFDARQFVDALLER